MFGSARITDTLVDIDVSGTTVSTAYQLFDGCTKLKTVRKLILPEKITAYSNVFRKCTALENITIEGTIAGSIDFSQCSELTADSMLNVVHCLKQYYDDEAEYGTKTLTVSSVAWQRFEDALLLPEVLLISYGSWENYIASKGWNLVLA